MSYFREHCAAINAACEHDSRAVFGAGLLTLLSIRQPFYLMPSQMRSIALMGERSQYLFGWKREGFAYLAANAEEIRKRANKARRSKAPDALDSLVLDLMRVPGFQIVKASFFAQMLIGRGACLDGNNLQRLGLSATHFRTPKTLTVATVQERIRTYNATWRAHGDSAYWWDSWCDYVAAKYPQKFADGRAVSALHLIALSFTQEARETANG